MKPYPLSEKYFLVACKPAKDALWGIYLVDVFDNLTPVSYTHLRAHETVLDLVCRLLLEKKKLKNKKETTKEKKTTSERTKILNNKNTG